MPFPVAAAIAGGAQLLGSGINAFSTGKMNKKSRKFAKEMYAQQRADNLADYHLQNEYNHPSSQMARLRQAGLNPNLVYGDGANMPTAQIKSADKPNWNPQAPQFDVGSAIGAYQNTKVQQAQIDLLREQTTATRTNADLNVIKTLVGGQDLASKALRNKIDYKLQDTQMDMIKERLTNLQYDTNKKVADMVYTQNQDTRSESINQASLQKIAAEIYTMGVKNNNDNRMVTATVNNLVKDGTLKDLEIALRKNNITFNDPAWQRILADLWQKGNMKKGIEDFIEQLKKPSPSPWINR